MLKSLFRNWSLERKGLLFLGLALFISLVLGFFAVQFVAERLVKETTRRSARDFANTVVRLRHATWESPSKLPEALQSDSATVADPLPSPDSELFESGSTYPMRSELLRIKDGLEHVKLGGDVAEGEDLGWLMKLHARLSELESAAKAKLEAERGEAASTATNGDGTANAWSSLANPTNALFEEDGPNQGDYIYYHPIRFQDGCRKCHQRSVTESQPRLAPVSVDPFRVLKIRIPVSETRVWRIWSYSLLSSIGIGTLALSLFFIHLVLKRLVINPLSELKFVSDEITSGKTDLQFRVDTDDEFTELSDSFNRMLRHLTETQHQLQMVNKELDSRIDELASVNLQLFEANRLKGEFLANMSHELRTPLNSILGFSDVLSGIETLTDKQRRWVGNIQNSGRILLEMINDILDLAKVEAGKMEVRPVSFDLLSVISAQVEIFRKLAEDKNIDLQVDSSRSELRIVQDQSKIAQILTNLLSNAIKFTPEGGLVTIAAEAISDQTVFFSVADTGIGIAPYEHEVIFEKFRQASANTNSDALTREHSGTGLGLSIVRELCRLLGGDISLTSKLGQGSNFRVVIPLRYGEVEALGESSEA